MRDVCIAQIGRPFIRLYDCMCTEILMSDFVSVIDCMVNYASDSELLFICFQSSEQVPVYPWGDLHPFQELGAVRDAVQELDLPHGIAGVQTWTVSFFRVSLHRWLFGFWKIQQSQRTGEAY